MPTDNIEMQRCGAQRVLVVGDILLDRYTWGRAERISPEAPVVVLRRTKSEHRLGGAASVAQLLSGLDAEVMLAGVLGNDSRAATVRRLLDQSNMQSSLVLRDAERPTSLKERFLGQSDRQDAQQILRVDDEQRTPLSPKLETAIGQSIRAASQECQAILISDYGKGVCTPAVIQAGIAAAKENKLPLIVDPARGVDLHQYHGADMLTPNRTEASLASGRAINTIDDALSAAVALRDQAGVRSVLITLDRDGMVCAPPEGSAFHLPTKKREICDVTGAGDTVLALLGIGHARKVSLRQMLALANAAAGIQVERLGVAAVSWPEIHADLHSNSLQTPSAASDKLTTENEIAALAAEHRAAGRRVVLANGCFDLLHVGHVSHLQAAKSLGDVLIVAINSDAGVRRLKGPTRPIISQEHRAAMLCALACVDHVFTFDADTPHELLERIQPDILAKGNANFPETIIGREIIETNGGQALAVGCVEGVSTTEILAHLSRPKPKGPATTCCTESCQSKTQGADKVRR